MAARVAPPQGMSPIGSGKGWHLFSLGDCLGIGVGGVAEDVCSSTGGVHGGWMSEGVGDVCPNSK